MTLRRILILDDDSDIRTIVRMSLEFTGGFEVVECSEGGCASHMVKEHKPDLVLLDVMMPDMDGPSVLQMLRNDPETAYVPVIFLTAKIRSSDVENFEKLDALGVIGKPFDPMTLSATIQNLWKDHS